MRHLEYLGDLRVHMVRPGAFIVVLMDGVQTHVTGPMQTYFASKNLALGLRPPTHIPPAARLDGAVAAGVTAAGAAAAGAAPAMPRRTNTEGRWCR